MSSLPPGTRIGQYEIASRPMVGGMGVVYFCLDHGHDGRPVALKTFKPEYLPDRAARDRFLREGSAWVNLGAHAHIVRCYAVQYLDPTAFIVLELIAKEQDRGDASLRAWLGQPLPMEQALLFAIQIARGMQYAVEKIPGFVHRDLKPENILVGADKLPDTNVNRLRVTDFGLAAILRDEVVRQKDEDTSQALGRTHLTRGILGTPLYMAPEQWRGEVVGVYTDVYALGCILYEMLTGQRAAEGQSLSAMQSAHCTGNLRPLPGSLPMDVVALLKCCLALAPSDRYGDWQTLTAKLEDSYAQIGRAVPQSPTLAVLSNAEQAQVGWSYIDIGVGYLDMGKAEVAVRYFEQALSVGQRQSVRQLEEAALTNLGIAYAHLSDVQHAIACHKRVLVIAREIGDRRGEGKALGNLGGAYARLGEARRAIGYYEQALTISHEIGDRHEEETDLGNLGIAYAALGEARRAIEYYEQALTIAHGIGDRRGESKALGNIGLAYVILGEARRAIGYYEQDLAITREIGDRLGEGNSLGNIGEAYRNLGDAGRAMEYYRQQLIITREIGDRRGNGVALSNMGIAYAALGNVQQAIECYEQALIIAREIGDRVGEGNALCNLGIAYGSLGNYQRAIEHYILQLVIVREIGDRQGESNGSWNLGLVYARIGDIPHAIAAMQVCVDFERSIGHPEAEKDAAKVSALRAQLQSSGPPARVQTNPAQVAFEAFQGAGSPQAMQTVVKQYPVLKDRQFIQTIEKAIEEQVPPGQKPTFELRLAWLKQIAGK